MREREEALRQREETFRRRLNEELESELRQARKQIDDVIAELKTKTAAAARDARAAGHDDGRHRRDAIGRASAVDTIVSKSQTAIVSVQPASAAGRCRAPAVGDRVVLGGLGLEGIVTAVHDGTADLDVRGKRMRASVRDLAWSGDRSRRRRRA